MGMDAAGGRRAGAASAGSSRLRCPASRASTRRSMPTTDFDAFVGTSTACSMRQASPTPSSAACRSAASSRFDTRRSGSERVRGADPGVDAGAALEAEAAVSARYIEMADADAARCSRSARYGASGASCGRTYPDPRARLDVLRQSRVARRAGRRRFRRRMAVRARLAARRELRGRLRARHGAHARRDRRARSRSGGRPSTTR